MEASEGYRREKEGPCCAERASNICQTMPMANLLLLMVFDGAVTTKENRQNCHDNKTAICNRHSLGRRRCPRGGNILILGHVFARLGRDLVHCACHLEYVYTTAHGKHDEYAKDTTQLRDMTCDRETLEASSTRDARRATRVSPQLAPRGTLTCSPRVSKLAKRSIERSQRISETL